MKTEVIEDRLRHAAHLCADAATYWRFRTNGEVSDWVVESRALATRLVQEFDPDMFHLTSQLFSKTYTLIMKYALLLNAGNSTSDFWGKYATLETTSLYKIVLYELLGEVPTS